MNEVMQIESSTCNKTSVAQHVTSSTPTTVTRENITPGVHVSTVPVTAATTVTVASSGNNGSTSTVAVTGSPMVITVNQSQSGTGPPVLKLVQSVDGGPPQFYKVVPASAVMNQASAVSLNCEQIVSNATTPTYTISNCLSQISTSSTAPTLYQNTPTVTIVQKMNDEQSGQNHSADGTVVPQRMFSIVSGNQQKALTQPINAAGVPTSAVIQKAPFNNGQQRVHALATQLSNARVITTPGSAAGPKVQILSNVVVSKQNIVINKATLQPQRQIITTIPQKLNSINVPKTVIAAGKTTATIQQPIIQQQLVTPKMQNINNLVITTNQTMKPVLNNSINPKTLKTVVSTMNRAGVQPVLQQMQPQKTIKTLSPGSPQPGSFMQKTTGIKTLTPSVVNHYNKIQNPVKMISAPSQMSSRVGGIKTLGPQKNPGNRANMAPKPNYIGKHASQAQKVQKPTLQGAKNRNLTQQRTNNALLSPTKYNNQKSSIVNSQSNYNQQLSTQMVQNLSPVGVRTVTDNSYTSTKNYPLQSPHDDSSLSEDIGEEIRPDFSPNLSYLYQVVMLDHNYGAPPPPVSPPPVIIPRSSTTQHTSPGAASSALNGALLAAVGREREKEREREQQTNASYYNTASAPTKRNNRQVNNISNQLNTMPPINQTTTNNVASNVQMIENRSSNLASSATQDDDAASTISSEGGRADGDEGEETETAPEGEGDEDGVTRCICDFVHDDGYMICCDVCSSWQHIVCMGIDREKIPDKYQCVRCQPRRVDRQHARSIQLKRLKELPALAGTVPLAPVSNTEPRSGSGHTSDTGSDTSTAESTGDGHHATTHYGRHQTGKLSLNNNLIGKKRGAPVSLSTRRKSEPASRRAPLSYKRQQRRESTRETSAIGKRTAAMKKREKNKAMKRKIKSRSSVDDDSQDSWHGITNAYTSSASILQLRQWIENYEEAVTNHYSPELRARITNLRMNGTHNPSINQINDKQAPPTAQADVAVQKCRVNTQSLTGLKTVLASQALISNTPVIELRGKYMLSTQHRTATGSGSGGSAGSGLQTRQHSQRPGPFLFFYRLPRDGTEVCVDTRTYGNDARFIRRSCRPNAELRHLVEKGTLHLYVITIANVDKNSELTIKHESHDLAAIAAASSTSNSAAQAAAAIASAAVPCACGGGPQTCGLYNNIRKNNGIVTQEANNTSNTESNTTHRKRRGRRASTPNRSETPPPTPEKEPPTPIISPPNQNEVVSQATPPPPPPALSTRRASSHQKAVTTPAPPETRTRGSADHSLEREKEHKEETHKSSEAKNKKKLTREERKMEAIMKAFERLEKAEQRKQEVQARQAQRRESDPNPSTTESHHNEPHKRQHSIGKHQENGETDRDIIRTKRKKRKGRARTISTNSQPPTRRRTRVNSTDSYMTSGDESSLLSPPLPPSINQDSSMEPRHTRSMTSLHDNSVGDNNSSEDIRECMSPELNMINKFQNAPGSQVSDINSPVQVNTAAGLLLALANGGTTGGGIHSAEHQKSPEADGNSSGSNSSLQSSPGTPLSSACLLVAAAVGPLEPGFKFPKTKKAIMNEWLNKPSDPIPQVPTIAPMSLHTPSAIVDISNEISGTQTVQASMEYYTGTSSTSKSLATLVQAASLCDSPPQNLGGRNIGQGAGNAKKRWLRQAISEECDSPCSRPESPPTGAAEMVAPPKKRRLARESLSSEQSFTPPTTPTMLVPPSNSLTDEDYPNNDEEFYTTDDRNASGTLSDSSPPTVEDTPKESVAQGHSLDATYNNTSLPLLNTGSSYQHGPSVDEIDSEVAIKNITTDVQIEFNNLKKDETAKKYPDALPTSLLDPRLGRDPRPMFRDSAQLLGTVEKTIRFYEENLTGPVVVTQTQIISPPPTVTIQTVYKTSPVSTPITVEIAASNLIAPISLSPSPTTVSSLPVLAVKEKVARPGLVTPAKRKLSISEYRQRKQQKSVDRTRESTPELANSPETPPPVSTTATTAISTSATPTTTSSHTNSQTTSVSSNNSTITTSTTTTKSPRARSRSTSSSSSTSSLSSDEELLPGTGVPAGDNIVTEKNSNSEPQLPMAFNSAPTAVERQRENIERLKKAFGLALDDETRKNAPSTVTASPVVTRSPKPIKTSPLTINSTITSSELLAKISEPSITTKLMLSLETTKYPETKFSLDAKFTAKRPKTPERKSPERVIKNSNQEEKKLIKNSKEEEKILIKNSSPEPEQIIKPPVIEEQKKDENNDTVKQEVDEAYSKFDDAVSTSFIPPFNNPIYPNSTQFTGFSSVIDSSPYEGRNPSPPPSELLKTNTYSLTNSTTSLTMSPSGYK